MSLLENSLQVVKIATAMANPELLQAATKANVEALELSTKNLELHREAEELKKKVKELEDQLTLVGEVFREGDMVFHEGVLNACCSRCWDIERKLCHIVQMDKGKGQGMGWGCPGCKTLYWRVRQNPRMANSAP